MRDSTAASATSMLPSVRTRTVALKSSIQNERVEFFRFQDKIIHLVEFGVLGLLVVRAAYLGGSRSRRAYWWCIGLAILYGALDELHQYYIPGRTVELADVAADGLGVFLLAWAYLASRGERLFHKSI